MKIIELKQAPVVLVELPEVADNLQIFNDIGRPYLSYYTKPVYAHRAYLPDGDYVVLGFFSDLTEEQFAELVGKHEVNKTNYYQNYTPKPGRDFRDIIDQSFISAKVAFYSLLESENVYTENPYEPLKWWMTFAKEFKNKWQEAQQRTIDPKRTVVLISICE